MSSLSGSCFCGNVHYAVSADLHSASSCHCSRCRKAFSGAGSAYAEVEPNAFSWTQGEEQVIRFEPQPGWGLGFCGNCGSTLVGYFGDQVHGVTLGCVNGDPGVQIEMHIHVDSRAPWDHIGGDAPRFAQGPLSLSEGKP